eukprot:tig00020801_g13976.t1
MSFFALSSTPSDSVPLTSCPAVSIAVSSVPAAASTGSRPAPPARPRLRPAAAVLRMRMTPAIWIFHATPVLAVFLYLFLLKARSDLI